MQQARREQITAFYVTEALRLLTENSAKLSGGSYLRLGCRQILAESGLVPEDAEHMPRAQEVIEKIRQRLGQ